MLVKVLPTELDVGVKDRSITQPRIILITRSNGGIFGASVPYDRTLTYPLRFNTWGTREIRTHAQALYKRNVQSEIRNCTIPTTPNVKLLPTGLVRLTNRLPNLSLRALSPPGTDRIYESISHQHAVPIF